MFQYLQTKETTYRKDATSSKKSSQKGRPLSYIAAEKFMFPPFQTDHGQVEILNYRVAFSPKYD